MALGDGTYVFLEYDLLGRGRTDNLGKPAQMSGAPVGAAHIADVLAQQEGFEAVLGGLEILYGIVARAVEVLNVLVLDCRNVDGGEIT